jgi:hypothetical protein
MAIAYIPIVVVTAGHSAYALWRWLIECSYFVPSAAFCVARFRIVELVQAAEAFGLDVLRLLAVVVTTSHWLIC